MRYCALIGTWKVIKEYKARSVVHALSEICDWVYPYNRGTVVLVTSHYWILFQLKKYWRLLEHTIHRSRLLRQLRKQRSSR
ncbi:MAG: hypothetical protein LUC85_00545 [Bacteroidales bacterium]|nr:hypothetical protein [Bacteroidales bacterium]